MLSACQQLCQQPNQQPIQSLVDTQWRLVETTDPALAQELDRFNFKILTFRGNFQGEFQDVVFNDLVETPQATFRWNVESDFLLMALQPTAGGTETQLRFDYTKPPIGRALEMVEADGSYYRYVPFTGVVNPDSTCTF